jgi:nucleotide-binding universal stress UspA family protein
MDVLVPVDGSDTSFRALDFGIDLARRFEGSLHVVHFTDVESEATERIVERAREALEAASVASTPEVTTDVALEFRPEKQVGDAVLELVDERGYDHVVMGHHGSGTVERAILGSATETVIRADAVPVTVVP